MSLSCPLASEPPHCLPPRGFGGASYGASLMEHWKTQVGLVGLGLGERHLQYKTTPRATLRMPSSEYRIGTYRVPAMRHTSALPTSNMDPFWEQGTRQKSFLHNSKWASQPRNNSQRATKPEMCSMEPGVILCSWSP